MSTDTLVGGDLDVDIALEEAFHADLPCDGLGPCPNAARWGYRCRRCSYDHHMCDEHRVSVDGHIAHGHPVHCSGTGGFPSTCGLRLPSPVPWRPL